MASDDSLENRLRDSVRDYLTEDKWKVTPVSGAAAWAWVGEDDRGRKIVVGQQKDRDDAIFIQARLLISDDWRERLAEMPAASRTKLFWDLRFELLHGAGEFQLDLQGDELKSLVVSNRIFFDALTKDLFFQRVSDLRKSLLRAQWMLSRGISSNAPQDDLLDG